MRRKKRLKKPDLHKGVFILPNLFTTMNLFCGFYSVAASIKGEFMRAAIAIIVGAFFDAVDGRVARATKSTSRFGIEYDSLADLICFGMAPGIMLYLWALPSTGRLGWAAGFLFMACGALRLARFNAQFGTISSSHFVGLPIPAAAGMCAATVLFFHRFDVTPEEVQKFALPILALAYILSFLMVSTIKYNSFKSPGLYREKSFEVLVAVLLVMVLIATEAAISLFAIGALYISSGPAGALLRLRKTGAAPAEETETAKESVL
jgi:CDP-diacylglycerol--serine O-phosphatidyltransferase